MSERCKVCAGPVEAVHLDHRGGDGCTVECYNRALPDTLEGIEAEDFKTSLEHEVSDALWKTITRLFNGCAECGRRPLDRNYNVGVERGVMAGKRQACQHAADQLEARARRIRAYPQNATRGDGRGYAAWLLEDSAADLRKLAEEA